MIRIIRTELRRSTALSLFALLTIAAAVLLLLNIGLWRDQWLKLGSTHSSSLFLLLPLALAGGAMLGRRDKRTGVEELIAGAARPRVQRILPAAAALAIAVTVSYLLVYAAAATLVGVTGSYRSIAALPEQAAAVLVLIGGAWLGLAAGRAWSSLLLPPALAVLALGAQLVASEAGPMGQPPPLANLSMLPQPPGADWETVTNQALLGQVVFGAGLVVAGFLLIAYASWLLRAAAVATLAGAMVLTVALPGNTQRERYRVDAGAQALVCADGAPQICVTAVHAHVLPAVVPEIRRALGLLAKLPGAPQRVEEWRTATVWEPGLDDHEQPVVPVAPGTLRVDLDLENSQQVSPYLVQNIVNGAGTTWSGCFPEDDVARAAAGAWLMDADDLTLGTGWYDQGPEFHDQVKDAVRRLRSLPPAEQTRRVTALRDAGATCQPELLPILIDGAQP
ncbi:MAG: hypothetical protein ABW046_21810 [Actinoplanes sp.]